MARRSEARKIPNDSVTTALKHIRLRPQKLEGAELIAKSLGLRSTTARVLAARGYEADDKLRNFINPTLKEGIPAPEGLKNLDKACELIAHIVKQKGRVTICCDFDVDGLSAGAQIHHFLQALGVASSVKVPNRFEDGYGLNKKMIAEAVKEGSSLLITIDYGTTNCKELAFAREQGLKTIVIDHHHVGDHKPGADVFINPHQEGCGFAGGILCAAGLAWYLLLGLRTVIKEARDIDARRYLDLACLGTICDMVPLIGANRVIAKRGMEVLAITERAGLHALKHVAGVKKIINCSDISFGIGPRLNAAGRIEHGSMVIDLLTTTDQSVADKLAAALNVLNTERQETEAQVKEQVLAILKQRGIIEEGIVVADPSFHTGVIGIVAQRIVELYYRPTAIMGIDSDGIFKGSVRGIKGFSVITALDKVSKYLLKFGGHEGAGGFSVAEENLASFSLAFVKECARQLAKLETNPLVEADTECTLEEIDVSLVNELRQLSPFGVGNPQPLLLLKNLQVVEVRDLKGAHLKAVLSDGKRFITGLLWRQATHPALRRGASVNIVCKADYNNFNGLTELQAIIQAAEVA